MEPVAFTLSIAKRIKDAKIKMEDGSNFDLFGDPSEYIPAIFDDPVILAQVWKEIIGDKRPMDAFLATMDGRDLSEEFQAVLDGLPNFSSLPHLKRAMASLYREKIKKVKAERERVAQILYGTESTEDSPLLDTAPTSGT